MKRLGFVTIVLRHYVTKQVLGFGTYYKDFDPIGSVKSGTILCLVRDKMFIISTKPKNLLSHVVTQYNC